VEPAADEGAAAAGDEEPDLEDDGRVEGTTLYLPPEVVRGGAPTLAADAWALGCLTYQLLSGKPPIWVDSEVEEELRSRIVTFQFDDGGSDLASLSENARSFVAALMQADVSQRLAVTESAQHAFFEGTDVFALYKKPRGPEIAAASREAPQSDARWQKRQFSKIWTVMPSAQDYVPPETFGGKQAVTSVIPETELERDAPFSDEVGITPPTGRSSETGITSI